MARSSLLMVVVVVVVVVLLLLLLLLLLTLVMLVMLVVVVVVVVLLLRLSMSLPEMGWLLLLPISNPRAQQHFWRQRIVRQCFSSTWRCCGVTLRSQT